MRLRFVLHNENEIDVDGRMEWHCNKAAGKGEG